MDIVLSLRQLEFPDCAARALEYIAANLDVTKPSNQGSKDKGEEVLEAIANDFIFGTSSRTKLKFSPLEEIQGVNVILTFFSSQHDSPIMLGVFRVLFNNLTPNDGKTVFFTKILSCAINVQNKTFLELTATWMQMHGCKSDVVLCTVKNLLSDHCTGTSVSYAFKQLPSSSTLLTCHVITSVTHLYSVQASTGQNGDSMQLTQTLLELICDWMTQDPIVCLVSLYPKYSQFLQSSQQVLWTSPTKSNTQTAIPGLVKWCTKAPFLKLPSQLEKVDSRSTLMSDLMHKEDVADQAAKKRMKVSIPDHLWSRLFFLVIKTLSIFPKVPGSNLFELITLADMMQIIRSVASSCTTLQEMRAANSDFMSHEEVTGVVQLSLDRVAQVLQMSLSTGAFRCCLVDLKTIFDLLPQTKLMKIIQNHHNAGLPPAMLAAPKDV